MITGDKFKLVGHLKRFIYAVQGWFPRPKERYRLLGEARSLVERDIPVETQLALSANFSSGEHFHGSELRLRCLKVLQTEQALTIPEMATRLGQSFSTVEPLLQELRAARLIEFSGTRRVGERVRALFRLNPLHPSLESLLGPAPVSLRYPEGYIGDNVG